MSWQMMLELRFGENWPCNPRLTWRHVRKARRDWIAGRDPQESDFAAFLRLA